MSRPSRPLLFALLLALAPATAAAQSMTEPTHDFTVSRVLHHPASEVWTAVAEDYGQIAESHPRIVRSAYEHGSLRGELGAERACWFDDAGHRVLHEQITAWDPGAMTFTNRILEAAHFPVDPDNTRAVYRVEDLGDGTSRLSIDMSFRTKPAMMGAMMVGPFENLLGDYLIALDHHLDTGEPVTRENFRAVARNERGAP